MHLRFFGIAAALFSSVLAAHASELNFSTMGGTNTAPFSSYTEDGYVITNSAGQYLVGMYFGDPVPDLFSGSFDQFFAPGATPMASITVARTDGGAFSFQSADLADDVLPGTYLFSGSDDGSVVFSQGGAIQSTSFLTYNAVAAETPITSLTITETGGDFNVDNIVVQSPATSVTPEPSSLLLLGTGLLALAGGLRRRVA